MENTCVCCGVIIPEGRQVCPSCENGVSVQNRYVKFNCPECGALLEVSYDGTRASYPENMLIRHCKNCGCDWVSDYMDDGNESELQRKFWG